MTETVHTRSGPVSGKIFDIKNQGKVGAFLGIPYAEPPIGELRFKKPVPVKRWTETRNCTEFGPRCPQNDEFELVYNFPKDESKCLTLNVFSPIQREEEKKCALPIMLWIHGGGFVIHGSVYFGDQNIAQSLCSKDVIVVTINYRLGIFGFLRTGDECRGNLGLWDMTLALKWVKDNAETFGGNPSNITLFGQSAGGASVDLLSLSPHSRDCFQKVAPMGGCANNDFALKTADEMEKITYEFAKFIGYTGSKNDEDLLTFYKSKTADELSLSMAGVKGFGSPGELFFTPNLDGDFLPKPLHQLRGESPRKSVLTGVAKNEGLLFLGLTTLPRNIRGLQKLAHNSVSEGSADSNALRTKIVEFYLKGVDRNDEEQVVETVSKLLGDNFINRGVYSAACERVSNGEDVHFYSFDYHNPNGFGLLEGILPFLDSTHGTELNYLFGKGIFVPFEWTDDDQKMSDTTTECFTNFAKNGIPLPYSKWPPFNPSSPSHFSLSLNPEMRDGLLEGRMDFWRELAKKKSKI